jgi:hypothetical protein
LTPHGKSKKQKMMIKDKQGQQSPHKYMKKKKKKKRKGYNKRHPTCPIGTFIYNSMALPLQFHQTHEGLLKGPSDRLALLNIVILFGNIISIFGK